MSFWHGHVITSYSIHYTKLYDTQTSQQFYSHPLWANGVCDPCHLTASTFSVPGVSSRASSRFKTGGGIPGKLVRPQNMLCLRCHTDKSPLRALSDNLWLHNTTAKGDCLECHSQHQSEYPHVLKKQGTVICFPCHEKGKYLETPVHQQAKSCLDCHNPHMGKNRNLLTSEFKEIKVPVTDVPGHPELSVITSYSIHYTKLYDIDPFARTHDLKPTLH